MSVVIDIDGTLLDIRERLRRAMNQILNCEVSKHDVRNMATSQIFDRYASPEQQSKMGELTNRLWDILLCKDDIGIELLRFDEPIPHAAEVLESWNEDYQIVYLTGRIEQTREHTRSQLEEHGFPVDRTQLVMFQLKDYNQARSKSIGPKLIKTRSRLFSFIVRHNDVLKVVDDFPGYFRAYRKHDIPDLIGLAQSSFRTEQSFLGQGAMRVIRCWSELLDS